jgi:hemerythrin superfamily protein
MAKGKQRRSGAETEATETQDALSLLEAQHRAVEDVFEQLQERSDGADASALVRDLAILLVGHAAIEEQHFYPSVRNADTEQLVSESLHDHNEVKKVLLQLLDTDASNEEFGAMLEDLEGLVESHVGEEEDELFPRVRELLSAEERRGLAQQMVATLAGLGEDLDPRQRLARELSLADAEGTAARPI